MPATAESNLLNINLDEIIETERILLPVGKSFDAERRRFIKNFETIDLQAVPGSGKTTALLAKLLILEKRLPLSSNRGILILSHTNTAVDEIKDKIGIHCSKLFSYPNFMRLPFGSHTFTVDGNVAEFKILYSNAKRVGD